MMLTPAAESTAPVFRPDTVATDLEASLRYCWRQYLSAQELAKPGFMTLCAVRHDGEIVDFEWDYVNGAAARMFLGTRDRMVGQRLLDSLLGRRRLSAVFAHYRRVADGLTSETLQHEHAGNGIDGSIRHVATRLGDGVAVTLSNLTAVTRANALRVELMRHRAQLQHQQTHDDSVSQPLVLRCDADEAVPSQYIELGVPQPPVRGMGRAIRWRVFSGVSDVLAKCRLGYLGALAARSASSP